MVVPGWRELRVGDLVLDVNGTLTCDGNLPPGVPERVSALRELLSVHLLSANTLGRLADVASGLAGQGHRLESRGPEVAQEARLRVTSAPTFSVLDRI